jgi:hypothetical protein
VRRRRLGSDCLHGQSDARPGYFTPESIEYEAMGTSAQVKPLTGESQSHRVVPGTNKRVKYVWVRRLAVGCMRRI